MLPPYWMWRGLRPASGAQAKSGAGDFGRQYINTGKVLNCRYLVLDSIAEPFYRHVH
jgi:hypothetical protein